MLCSFTRENVEFKSDSITLRGWLYKPKSEHKIPAIIMAHGYACIKELYLDKYAEFFAKAGFAVLVYDHRNFGESDVIIAQEIDPIAQINDWRNAITYMQTLSFVDHKKLGIWGTSLAGGHVLVLGALDKRVKCIVSQVPTISGLKNLQRRIPIDKLETLFDDFEKERISRYQGEQEKILPLLSQELLQQPFTDNRNDYRALFDKHQASESEQWRFKNLKNHITLLSLENYANYNPGHHLKNISPTPTLMIIADHDTITMTEDELEAYAKLNEPKELKLIKGGHFTVYYQALNECATIACEWFTKWLKQ